MPFIISCEKKIEKDKKVREQQKIVREIKKEDLNFSLNAKPEYFSARTINGKLFNSADYKGKTIVIFIYDKSYLVKSGTYDMSEEFNGIYNTYKDKAKFIGIIEGFNDSKAEFDKNLKNSKIAFDQIDNTISENTEDKLHYNLSCSPAKVIIDKTGKVILSTCGGKNDTELVDKLKNLEE